MLPDDIKQKIADKALEMFPFTDEPDKFHRLPENREALANQDWYEQGAEFGYSLAQQKIQEANNFIIDIAKLLGEDGLGYDDLKWSIDDFKDTIEGKDREIEKLKELLGIIDDRLSAMEDYTHGADGRNITWLRKQIINHNS